MLTSVTWPCHSFLSACPPLYWYMAHYLLEERSENGASGSVRSGSSSRGSGGGGARDRGRSGAAGRRARWLWTWLLAYNALGCLLFVNFYPWV